MFAHNSIRNDARVQKEAASLSRAGWRVIVVGLALTETDIPAVESIDGYTIWRVIPPLPRWTTRGSWGKLLRLIVAMPLIIGHIRATQAQVFHGNDFIGLLIMALAGVWRRPIIYDAHELFFDQWNAESGYPLRRLLMLLRPLEGWLARRAVAVMTVGDKLADRLAQTLYIPRPLVVRNVVDLNQLGTAVPIERQPGERLVAHSGAVVQGRHLKELVDCLPHLPDDVILILIGDGRLRPALAAQAEALGKQDRLRMVYPVTPTTIPPTLAQADAAVVLISSFALSYHFALPNKLFEAVAAGVPLVVSDIPEVARLVRQYEMGIVVDSMEPKAIAAAIEQVLEPTVNARYRANVVKARESLNWAAEERKLVALYQQIFDGLL